MLASCSDDMTLKVISKSLLKRKKNSGYSFTQRLLRTEDINYDFTTINCLKYTVKSVPF